jgi:ribosomal protein L18
VIDFIQKQSDLSEKLVRLMLDDQKERMEVFSTWAEMNAQLIQKLEERDKLIAELRAKLQAYETAEAL